MKLFSVFNNKVYRGIRESAIFVSNFCSMSKSNETRLVGYILTAIAVALLVGGFFCPPMGVIDGSVLEGVGLIVFIIAIFTFKDAFDKGRGTEITHGNTSIKIDSAEKANKD